MFDFFLKILNMSVTASYVIIAILLIRLLLRKAPKRYSYALWSVAAFRLVCPVSFKSVFSLFSLAPFDMTAAQSQGNGALTYIPPSGQITTGIPYLNSTIIEGLQTNENSVIQSIPSLSMPQETNAGWINYENVISVLWIVGVFALLFWSVFSLIKLRNQLRTAVLYDGNVFQSEAVRSPFILGVFRPRIYIPYGLTDEQLGYVLAHERCHLRRLDHVIKPLAFFILTVHWFNPFVWLGFNLMVRDMEMSCDDVVLGRDATAKKAYSTTLLTIASNRRFPSPTPLAFGETGVKARIKNVLSFKKPALWVTVAAVIVVCVVILLCAADPKNGEPVDPFGKNYEVDGLLYDSPATSFSYTDTNMPAFTLTADNYLIEYESHSGDILFMGGMEEFTLTKENFDKLIRSSYNGVSGWLEDDVDAAELRRNNHMAWRLHVEDIGYYVLSQKNGDILLCKGYYDSEGETDPYSDDSSIHAVFRLTEAELYSGIDLAAQTGRAYVSSRCVYMNLFSSTIGNDSGCRYIFEEDGLRIEQRRIASIGGDGVSTIYVDTWLWRELPYTEEEWFGLFSSFSGGMKFPEGDCYQPLDDDRFLLNNNGELWLVELRDIGGSNSRTAVWSIYALVPEDEMGVAYWRHHIAVSMLPSYMEISFLMDYDSMSAMCTDGHFFDDEGQYQNAVAITGDSSLRWYPYGNEMGTVESSQIYFSFMRDEKMLCTGTLYIHGEKGEYSGETVYTVSLVSDYARLVQDGDVGAIHLYIPSETTIIGQRDTRTFEEVISPAIENAIVEHNDGENKDDPDSEFFYDLETLGYLVDGELTNDVNAIYYELPKDAVVYGVLYWSEISCTDDVLVGHTGAHIPVALSFELVDGKYELTEYWEPRDGSYYVPDILEKFPDSIENDALDIHQYTLLQIQRVYAKAVDRFKMDPYAAIERLVDMVYADGTLPPEEAVKEHSIEYRELKYYGKNTLLYAFNELWKREQAEADGYYDSGSADIDGIQQDGPMYTAYTHTALLEYIAREMSAEMGEPESYAEDGMSWFTAFRKRTESVRSHLGWNEFAERYPAGALLMEIIYG